MKKKYGVFDIIGPVMIGPSSSHTAGAARIGRIARSIAGEVPVRVRFLLHGSFSKTYKGHGTDRALVAGILGMSPDDEELKSSLVLAKQAGLQIQFEEEDLGEVHPNSVLVEMTLMDGAIVSVLGSSIGGGAVDISRINGEDITFSGNYPTLMITQRDVPGVVANITRIMHEQGVNIAFMSVFRSQRGKDATMIFELDQNLDAGVLQEIRTVDAVEQVRFIPLTADIVNQPVSDEGEGGGSRRPNGR